MTEFVMFPIRRTWHTVKALTEFEVDVVENDGGVSRGYVCDCNEDGLLVKVGSGWQTLQVPFNRVRLPNDDMGDTLPEDIEVLMGINTADESWERATLISSWTCPGGYHYGSCMETYTLRYVTLDEYQSPTSDTGGILIDGDTRVTQRARRRGQESAEVTANTFCKITVPMPPPVPGCPDPASVLRKAVVLPKFQEQWLCSTDTIFVASDDDHVEVLRRSDFKPPYAEDSSEVDYYLRVFTRALTKWPFPTFLERFDKYCSAIVLDMIKNIVSAVVHLKDESGTNDPHFQYLPVVIHLKVLSYLDVYVQNQLKRAFKFVQPLLATLHLQRSAIIPAHEFGNVDCGPTLRNFTYWEENNSFILLNVIPQSVTGNVKILYLTGNWINCLHPLTCLLELTSLKLDWLVIAENSCLQINEFKDFPGPHHIMSDAILMPSYWKICRHVALKNVSFSSCNSICFHDHGNCQLSPSSLTRCYSPFLIPVSRWSVNLDDSNSPTEQKWNNSVRLMFNNFCPKMSNEEISTLMDWLNRTDLVENLVLWTCVCRCFSLWGVKPPGDVSCLRCVVVNGLSTFVNPPKEDPNAPQRLCCALSKDFPEKNIVMRTLALLIPHADPDQPLRELISQECDAKKS